MAPTYEKGQQIVVRPVNNQNLSPRDSDLEPYSGQRGIVTDYYWISLDRGVRTFYIYNVRISDNHKQVVLHEDEIQPYLE